MSDREIHEVLAKLSSCTNKRLVFNASALLHGFCGTLPRALSSVYIIFLGPYLEQRAPLGLGVQVVDTIISHPCTMYNLQCNCLTVSKFNIIPRPASTARCQPRMFVQLWIPKVSRNVVDTGSHHSISTRCGTERFGARKEFQAR